MILFPCSNGTCIIKEYCLAYFENCNADESISKKYIPRVVDDKRVTCENYIHPLRVYGEFKIIKNNRKENNE